MPVTIYVNSSDKKVIGKTLATVTTMEYVLLDSCDILNPQIVVTYASNILTSNYAYIAEFNRYYFITNVTVLNGNELLIDMQVDVLETYKTQIKALTCIVKRNSNVYNLYLDDPYFQASSKKQLQTKTSATTPFTPNTLTSATTCFVLTVAKGG